jgi:hypothetical protein
MMLLHKQPLIGAARRRSRTDRSTKSNDTARLPITDIRTTPLRKRFFVNGASGHIYHEFNYRRFCRDKARSVEAQEGIHNLKCGTLVPVDERMVFRDSDSMRSRQCGQISAWFIVIPIPRAIKRRL